MIHESEVRMEFVLDEIGFLYGRQAIGKGFEKGIDVVHTRAGSISRASKKELSTSYHTRAIITCS